MNQVIKAPKFRITLTLAALQVIEKDDYLFSFYLKSAYLQVNVNENFLQYFGFGIKDNDRSRRFFQYKNLPFGLNDAMRVLTKLLRSLLEKWRKNDGLGIV